MPNQIRKVNPGYKTGTVITENGEVLTPPSDWAFLAAGDAALTRNVKKRGPHWQVIIQKGRRTISKGIWVKEEYILTEKTALEAKRATPEYARKRQADLNRRERKQQEYADSFYRATLDYLDFPAVHMDMAEQLAREVSDHATPVGSGTVARTERIPLEKRVEAAVIAWMRHRTTAYDHMKVARIKGERRKVRRMLAQRSAALLDTYRSGEIPDEHCPLKKALTKG